MVLTQIKLTKKDYLPCIYSVRYVKLSKSAATITILVFKSEMSEFSTFIFSMNVTLSKLYYNNDIVISGHG